jgi:hypothetical protein
MDSVRNLLAFCFAIGRFAAPMSSKALITDYTWHVCNGCSFSQASGVARAFGVGNHYVYNLPGNHLYLFAVTCESGTCYADSITPAANAQSSFNTYRGGYLQFQAEVFHATVNYTVPSGSPRNVHNDLEDDGYVNAFDTLYITQLESPLITQLHSAAFYTGALAQIISMLSNGFVCDIPNMSINVFVYFHDGSVREFKYDQATDRFEGILGTAKDSQGNALPDPGHAAGPHQFMYNGPIARLYNVPNLSILFGEPYQPPGTDYYSCYYTGDTSGGSLTCVKQQ